jgi:hypothetical protein
MELALNLVWAVIAASSYALLFRRLAFRGAWHGRGQTQAQCIAALTCALAILFPVISLTDDLHEMQATAEEATSSGLVIKKCVVSHWSNQGQNLHQVLFTFPLFAASVRWTNLGGLAARRTTRLAPGLVLSALGRAPPSFAVAQIG